MEVVLCGKFESAVLYKLSENSKIASGSHSYYMGIFRERNKSFFERSGTFLAISNIAQLPQVDWSMKQFGLSSDINESSIGIEPVSIGGNEWDRDTMAFVWMAYKGGAFSEPSLDFLSDVPSPVPMPDGWKAPRFGSDEPWGKMNYFMLHYLCRLLLQVRTAHIAKSFLVIGDEDSNILQELARFVEEKSMPTPFDMPDFNETKKIQGEIFVGGLLNFSPIDGRSIAAIRSDPLTRRYAAQIQKHLKSPDGERGLLSAMREAMKNKKQSQNIQNIFEVQSWVTKPISYVPGLGTIVSVYSDLRDLLNKWAQRRQRSDEWYLLGPKMQNISVDEYLLRKANQE